MKKSLKALPLLAVAGLGLSVVTPAFAQSGAISVISREDGSGTRGAFVEIVGVVDGDKNDMTTANANIQNQTSGVMQTVAGDAQAIGYISLGSLDDSVKSVKVDGVEASEATITDGTYPIARPFNVAWSKDAEQSEVTKDFLKFIHSKEGQTIVEEEGYVAIDASKMGATEEAAGSEEASASEETTAAASEETTAEETTAEETTSEAAEAASEETKEEAKEGASVLESLPSYEATGELEGTIEAVGSTSVSPLMEKLAEAYKALQPKVEINITSNGSSAGMEAAQNGTADLGMASRELKDEEKQALESVAIALDGIAVIVNKENPVEELKLEAIKAIYLGELTTWEEAIK